MAVVTSQIVFAATTIAAARRRCICPAMCVMGKEQYRESKTDKKPVWRTSIKTSMPAFMTL
jgi:hypothetical protein